ncbi:hypothetical protein [Sandaracinus amylolyticus]|uniref:Uncharacterized protein n=1 Tax=Sandaracinus amylolyticus TaxID=927083 RepID=A0A0F6SGW9_9BACT|nr:hypothetical protein [Sandaracinus amylolyticus]AKF09424.1 hypothetical protein DB32_006573 [Sandaracinus amylolyticus]
MQHPLRSSFVVVALLLASGCAGTLPEPVYANQVEEYFPEPAADAPDAEAQRAMSLEARRCAAHLNERRSDAEVVSIIQATISGIGGATSGVGGALAAVDFGDPDITTAMGVMSSIGAGVTLVGNFIIGLLANPLEELRLHGQGQRSWEIALQLRDGGGDPELIRASLVRCTEDQAPPVRATGSGPAFEM